MVSSVSENDGRPRLSGHALVGREDGRFALEEVVTAPIGPTDVGVRTTWSGVSIGTEFAALTGKLDYGPFPITTGYMGVGIIEQLGAEVTGFSVGDRIYYGQNNELRTRAGDERITCASGVHASVAVVDPLGAGMGGAIVPDGVPDDVASMFVIPAVGLLGVDMAEVNVGAPASSSSGPGWSGCRLSPPRPLAARTSSRSTSAGNPWRSLDASVRST